MNKHFTVSLRLGLSLLLALGPLVPLGFARDRKPTATERMENRRPSFPGRYPARKKEASKARVTQDGVTVVPGQSVTLLPDGRWLTVGGEGDLATATIVDLQSGESITLASKLQHPRMGHSATMLPDGMVLIFGGVGGRGEYVSTAEVFNPETQRFEPRAETGLSPRANHTATLLTDGQLLVAGGTDAKGKLTNKVELYDTQRNRTTVLSAKLQADRQNHTAVLEADGTVTLSGGTDANGEPRQEDEIYEPGSKSLTATPKRTGRDNNTSPQLEFSAPGNGDLEVEQSPQIVLRFSKPLSVKTINRSSVALQGPHGNDDIRVVPAESGTLAFITPLVSLRANSEYHLTVKEATDKSGQTLPFVAITFKTKQCPPGEANCGAGPESIDPDSWIPDLRNLRENWRSGRSDSPARSLPPLEAPVGETALSGQVLTLSGTPLANVTLQIAEKTAATDSTGRFLLRSLEPGKKVLTIQGHTASRPGKTFGTFDVLVDITADKTTVLSYTIWLPVLDEQNAVRLSVPTRSETKVTTPRIPGMEVRLPSSAVLRLPVGKHHMHGMMKRELESMAITPIPFDRPPFPLPPGVEDGLLFTLQLHGAKVEGLNGEKRPGMRFVFPNYGQLPAGTRVNFWNYEADGAGWYMFGQGTVTPDGTQVLPDQGVELQSMQCISLMDKGDIGDGPAACCGAEDGDPVDLGTGLFVDTKVDLALPDVMPLSLSRTYRQNDSVDRSFGKGSGTPYDMYIYGNTHTHGSVMLADGGRIMFDRVPNSDPALFEHTKTPSRFYKATMRMISGVGPNGAWEVKLTDGTIYQFGIKVLWGNMFGPQASITGLSVIQDRYGHKLIILRDNDFRMTKIISPNGRWIEFSYSDSSKRITQAKDNIGRIVGYQYDASGRLWKVTDPAGGVTEYTYDSSHRMLTIKDARGIVYLTNEYNAAGRVSKQTLADGAIYLFAYTLDSNGKVVQTDVTDPRGDIRRVTFSANGYSLTDTRALGKPEEQSVTYQRDATSNHLLSITNTLGHVTTFQRNAAGSITSATSMAGTSAAATVSYTYDPVFNQLTSFTDTLSHTTTLTYDRFGNLTRITDPLGHQTNIAFNKSGQPISATDALGNKYQFAYSFGDLVEFRDPLGRGVNRTIDGGGRVTSVTDTLGQTTRYQYDALNQITSVTDAAGGVTSLSYDPNGNLLSTTDARSGTTSFTYNNMDRVITRTDPLQGATSTSSYEYDLMGNLIKATDRRGKVTVLSYDSMQRTTFIGFGAAGSAPNTTYESTINYTFDDANRLTQATDSQSGVITRSYNDLTRTMSETTPSGTVTQTFDAADRKTSMSVPGQSTISYSYDNADRITSIVQDTSTVAFAYDNANRRTSVTLPNGVVMAYSYDAASQITGLTYTQGSTNLGNLTYGYDNVGRRTSMGGSLARTTSPAVVSGVTHNAANQQTSFGGQSLTYDANGNLLTDGANSYTWNARNQLVGITGNVNASFGYDALGRRISKTINGNTTGYLYAGRNVVQELSGSTAIANLLTGRTDEVFSRSDELGSSHFLTDGLGSTLSLTDSAGATLTEYAYDPFGKTTTTGTSNRNPSQFTNRENDQTDLYFYRARYYSPNLQRFISEDPMGISTGPNPYAYVNNDPINFTDPSGKIPVFVLVSAGVGALAGGLGVVVGTGLSNWMCGRGFFHGIDSGGYWADVAIGAGSGAINGALMTTPLGYTRAGTMLLGAGSNIGQYGAQVLAGRTCLSGKGLLMSAATGAAGGLVGGKMNPPKKVWTGADFAPELDPNIGRAVIEGSNDLERVSANAAPGNILRTTGGSFLSNGPTGVCGC
ncbi:MAG TPA: RHS repeat-associated core domain-containing protein [Pyrinomonadaceae bacterium]